MEIKKIIIVTTLVVLVLIAIGIGIYYFINYSLNFGNNVVEQPTINTNTKTKTPGNESTEGYLPTPDEINAQNKINYPDTIIGIIDFQDKGALIKTTIRATNGKEYILSPNQPKAIYESFGVKDGNRVQIQGKIINGNVTWLTMKAI